MSFRISATRLLFASAIVSFALAAAVVGQRTEGASRPTRLDVSVYEWVCIHRLPAATSVSRLISIAGNPLTLSLVSIAIILLALKMKSIPFAAVAAIAIPASAFLTIRLKAGFAGARPGACGDLAPPSGYGFPSSHALLGTVVYGLAVAELFRLPIRQSFKRSAVMLAPFLVLLTAASRVYLAAHWLTDVLFGLSLGLGWTFVSIGYFLLFTRVSRIVHPGMPP